MPRFVVVGDHRRPIWCDWRARNEIPRQLIFEKIAAERPELVMDTGDLVPDASESAWNLFDRDVEILGSANIKIDAVPGNHETYGWIPRSSNAEVRMAKFLLRFPRDTQQNWGRRDFYHIRFLLLDSNVRILTKAQIHEQSEWIEKQASAADADPNIKTVIAVWHHPPFTNTTTYGDDRFTSQTFLPRLRKLKKLGAIFCGHVHAYERFWVESISMVVTGGGGAHRHRFASDHLKWRHTPAFDAYALPNFHYICVDAGGGADDYILHARVVHLDLSSGAARWIDGDRFDIRPRE
ncbi:MAG: metallophosphoesterase family protein [Planctomycetota bacterium]